MKSYPIPSKFESNVIMLQSCTGYVKPNNQDTTAPRKKAGVQHIRVDYSERVSQIL
jgi:hypothetical protein